jgi:hypothetical protein
LIGNVCGRHGFVSAAPFGGEQALADFAIAYAGQMRGDHRALLEATRDGRIKDR